MGALCNEVYQMLFSFSLVLLTRKTQGLATLSCESTVDRRIFLQSSLITASTGILRPSSAVSATPYLSVAKDKTVVVLGANGGTGRECVRSLIKSGRNCIATSRTGIMDFMNNDESLLNDSEKSKLNTGLADVTSFESMDSILKRNGGIVGAVIFAASASTKGGNAMEVDKEGVINAARACIVNNVQRLVIVSSGTVTRPDSSVYKLLNLVGKGIMEAKIKGEDAVRDMYADPDVISKNIGYTIIRPGGLTTGPSLGPSALELNQGDNKSGRLSRADVAELCVNCLDSPDAFDTTFECYGADTAKPVESVGISNILKSTDPTTFKSGKERRGDSWETLFKGLLHDDGYNIT